MVKQKSVLGLILGTITIVVMFFIFKPLLSDVVETFHLRTVTGAAKNAYTVYLYSDDDHVSNPKPIKLVFDDYVITVTNNDIKQATYEKRDEFITRVTMEQTAATGTYKEGIYVQAVGKADYHAVYPKEGDSLSGLYKATVPVIPGFEDYIYYGTLEKCDVYEHK